MSASAATGDRPTMLSIIERRKSGRALRDEDFRYLCRGVVDGTIPDYQLAAWLMATWFQGMPDEETLALTRAMVATGETLDWTRLTRPVVDKHSTGGVGDKTSLVLVPLVAACGLAFAKMSGRGLGHTGGTLDKLESIPGFRVQLSPEELREQVRSIGCALVGQSPGLVPADGALYALRDVTGTVDSVPLIASSVMSKKLAAGAEAIVLDVKYGAGAFMPRVADSRTLALAMIRIGEGAGRRVRAVLSSMERPLGDSIGNALEVREAIETLHGSGPPELWALTRELGVHLLLLTGVCADRAGAEAKLEHARSSGAALRTMELLVEAQGGDAGVVSDPGRLPSAPAIRTVEAARGGWIAGIAPRAIAEVVLRLGGARRVKGEAIDPAVGVRLRVKVGGRVEPGAPLAELHAASDEAAAAEERALRDAFALVDSPGDCPPEPSLEVVEAVRSAV